LIVVSASWHVVVHDLYYMKTSSLESRDQPGPITIVVYVMEDHRKQNNPSHCAF